MQEESCKTPHWQHFGRPVRFYQDHPKSHSMLLPYPAPVSPVKMVLHLRLLLDIVIVPNVVEWVHLYDLLFARHILVNQGFFVVFDFGEVLLLLDY